MGCLMVRYRLDGMERERNTVMITTQAKHIFLSRNNGRYDSISDFIEKKIYQEFDDPSIFDQEIKRLQERLEELAQQKQERLKLEKVRQKHQEIQEQSNKEIKKLEAHFFQESKRII